jgi:hypothetical protein
LAGSGALNAPSGYDFDDKGRGLHPRRMAASPHGLFGTLGEQGRVVQATGAIDLVDVATGLLSPTGLSAFPPQLGNVQLSALIIRIDSPVDVVLTDVLGRRVGVMNGQSVNEFGGQAYDSGGQTHPRLYVIQHPQAGRYTVRSTGTDSGPFKVHVYSMDSEKHVADHIVHAGHAEPGSAATHDFELSAAGRIAFANAAPVANAGFDQTANANAGGQAVVALDGSASSDPDGDTLMFTWAGPFGVLSGPQVNATLGVGVHVLTLTVDDGKGGVSEDTVTATVNGGNHAPVCSPLAQEVVATATRSYKSIAIGGVDDPDGDVLTMTVTGVQMDEADQWGATTPYPARILGAGVGTMVSGGSVNGLVQVRTERNGTAQAPGNGRVYHVLFTAEDGHGGVCTGDLKVGVRYSPSQPAIDDYPAVSKNALLANPQ